MFEENYRETFSKVTASQETHRRILQMTRKNKKTTRRGSAFFGKALVAAVIVSMLAVTASAAEEIEDYFYRFFQKDSQVELSDDQMQYIEDNTHTFPPEATVVENNTDSAAEAPGTVAESYTVTVDSALADESDAYLQLTLTAPAGVILDADDYRFDIGSSLMRDGRWISLLDASGVTEETAPAGNSVKLFCAFRLANKRYGTFADGQPVTLVLKELEEVRRIDGKEEVTLLSEDVWEIPITFQADTDTKELLSEPVTCQMQVYDAETQGQTAPQWVDARLTSLVLAPMSAEIQYELPGYETSQNQSAPAQIPFMTVVMEDGAGVRLVPRNVDAGEGKIGFSSNGPIVLDAVSHLLLPDGTKIPMPE